MKGPHQAGSNVWKAWLPALFWLGVIGVESTSALSAANTGAVLYPILHYLFGLDPIRFLTWHFVLRKSGHVIGYGVLSLLLFRAWRATIPARRNPRWSMVWACRGFFMTVLVASLDEWHQTLLPSRTGSVRDVVLDGAAAFVAQVLLFAWLRRWRSGEPGSPDNRTPFAAEVSEVVR